MTKDTFFRTFNVNSSIHIPDRYIYETEYVLSLGGGDKYDNNLVGRVTSSFSVPCFNTLPLDVPDLYEQFDDPRRIAALMLLMLRSIPVLLKAPVTDCQEIDDHCPKGDSLGIYCHGPNPHIELYPEAIYAEVNNDELAVGALITEVLIHELAHAVMDPCNYKGHKDCNSSLYRGYKHRFCGETHFFISGESREMNFYHVREESFANLITWRILHQYQVSLQEKSVKKIMKDVEAHMASQPASYSFALDIKRTDFLGNWVYSKEAAHPIDITVAFKWMEAAEAYHLDSKKDSKDLLAYSHFRETESKLGLPWGCGFCGKSYQIKRDYFTGKNCLVDEYGAFILEDIDYQRSHRGCVIKKNSKCGFLNDSADVYIPCVYEHLYEVDEGYAVCKDGKWGTLSFRGRPIIPLIYDDMRPGEDYYIVMSGSVYDLVKKDNTLILSGIEEITELERTMIIRINGKYGVIGSKSLNVFIPCDYEQIIPLPASYKVKYCGLFGIFDGSGRKLHDCNYDDIYPVGSFYKVKSGGSSGWDLIDKNGVRLTACGYDDITAFNGLCLPAYKVVKGGRTGLIDTFGAELLQVKYDEVAKVSYSNCLLKVGLNDRFGIVRISGTSMPVFVFDCDYEQITEYGNSLLAKNGSSYSLSLFDGRIGIVVGDGYKVFGGKSVVIRQAGKWCLPEYPNNQYDDLELLHDGRWNCQMSGKWGILEANAKKPHYVIDCICDSKIQSSFGHYYVVRQNDMYGIYTHEGSEMLKCEYDAIKMLGDGRWNCRKNGKWGVWDANISKVHFVIDCVCDCVSQVSFGRYYIVRQNGKCGIYTLGGKVLVKCEYDDIKECSEQLQGSGGSWLATQGVNRFKIYRDMRFDKIIVSSI